MEEYFGGAKVRMEEESQSGRPVRPRTGFRSPAAESDDFEEPSIPSVDTFITALAEERRTILADEKLSPRNKRALLEANQRAFVVATGGEIHKTDSVIYGILWFSGILLIVLGLLTAERHLHPEIMLSFVGTVLGGTIATIAQKLGKV